MAQFRYIRDVWKLAQTALANGGRQHSMFRYSWDISGDCQSPVSVEMHGRPYRDKAEFDRCRSAVVDLETRCRRCDNCRKARRNMWSLKAKVEYHQAYRTWFGTLTFRPEVHHALLERARHRLARQGVDFDTMSLVEQFAERHAECGREITLYLKRVRKQSRAAMRYLLVAEAHKSGLPHYHMLVHESDPTSPLRHALLSGCWNHGFEKWRLVSDERECAYVTKYLGKSKSARLRASLRYGVPRDDLPAFGHSGAVLSAERETQPLQGQTVGD